MDDGTWALVVFFLFTFAVISLLMFWPLTKQFISGLADPLVITAMGKIREVAYFGGVETRTLVKTSTSTVLLSGALELPMGADVERRSSVVSELLGRRRWQSLLPHQQSLPVAQRRPKRSALSVAP